MFGLSLNLIAHIFLPSKVVPMDIFLLPIEGNHYATHPNFAQSHQKCNTHPWNLNQTLEYNCLLSETHKTL